MRFLVSILVVCTFAEATADEIRLLADFRQPEIVDRIEQSTLLVREGARNKAKCQYGLPIIDLGAEFDGIDEQLWKLSRIYRGVEVGILEVLGASGEVMGLSEFFVGEKGHVAVDSKSIIRLVEKMAEQGNTLDKIEAIGIRHTHPIRIGDNGYFSMGDLMGAEGIRDDLRKHFDRVFNIRLSLLWWPKSAALSDLWRGSFRSVSKMSGFLSQKSACESILSTQLF